VPLHNYLLTQQGVPILELVYLEGLARDGVYSFAFISVPAAKRSSRPRIPPSSARRF
jgi:hypothetical protein